MHFFSIFAPFWAPTWHHFGTIFAQLGAFWDNFLQLDQLGTNLEPTWPTWAQLGSKMSPKWLQLEPNLGQLGVKMDGFLVILGIILVQKSIKN